MNQAEVFQLALGSRVVHKPTGETGTVVLVVIRVADAHGAKNDKRKKLSYRYLLKGVLVKNDAPAWMPPIVYRINSLPGRKVKDLERVKES